MRPVALFMLTLLVVACSDNRGPLPPTRAVSAEEIARAEAFLAQQTPLPGDWTFTTIDFGAEGFLRVGHAAPDNPRATVLFVPGYTSSPELASDILAAWYDLGFEVASVDLPGQGGSVRRADDFQKTYTGDFSVYGEAVRAAVRDLDADRVSDGPLIIAGSSLGGHSVLKALADGGLPEADGAFLLAPAVQPALDAPRFLVKWVVGNAIKSGRGPEYMDGQGQWQPENFDTYDYTRCGDRDDRNFKNAALYTVKPDLRVGGITNEFGYGFVASGDALMDDEDLKGLDLPVTMVLAGKDVIVENAPAEKLCRENIPGCEVVTLPEATHCLVIEDQKTQDDVHQALLGLLARLGGNA